MGVMEGGCCSRPSCSAWLASCGFSMRSGPSAIAACCRRNFEAAIFGHSLKTYGWIYLVVAAVLIVSAILVLSGSQVARWVGVAAGAIIAISAVWWMPYYPIWSLTYIAIGALVIYALVVYGGKADTA